MRIRVSPEDIKVDALSIERMAADPNATDDAVYREVMKYLRDEEEKARAGKQALNIFQLETFGGNIRRLRPNVMERMRQHIMAISSGCDDPNCGPKFSGGCKGCEAKGRQPKTDVQVTP